MIVSVSSKANFYGQNAVDNEIDHQNNGTCGCVSEEGESVSKDSETEEDTHSKGFIIICKHMECTCNITLARKSLQEYVVLE